MSPTTEPKRNRCQTESVRFVSVGLPLGSGSLGLRLAMPKRSPAAPEPFSPIGARIDALLTERGIGNNEFAARVGWTGGYLSKFLRQDDPSGLRVLRCAQELGVDFMWLLTGETRGGARRAFVASLEVPDEAAVKAIMLLASPDPDTEIAWWEERYRQALNARANVRSLAVKQEEIDAAKVRPKAPEKVGQKKSGRT